MPWCSWWKVLPTYLHNVITYYSRILLSPTVYPKTYAHCFVVLCFVVVMQSFIMNSHEVFIHIHQGCFAGTGAIVRLPQCQWSKPDGYGKISQCITTTKHSKAKTVCIFLGIYCTTTVHHENGREKWQLKSSIHISFNAQFMWIQCTMNDFDVRGSMSTRNWNVTLTTESHLMFWLKLQLWPYCTY